MGSSHKYQDSALLTEEGATKQEPVIFSSFLRKQRPPNSTEFTREK